jgi:trimeric autotransporter adhesin
MAAGLGFKEFTTGDVLTAADANGYLASQVVMVFADSAARTAAIASPQEGMISFLKDTNAVEAYDGAAWVGVGGGSSPLTTKGDLYTFSTTDARLAVGANGTVLTADSAESTGLKWATSGSSGLTFISRTVFSDVASQAIDDCFTSAYKAYLVVVEQFFAATGTDDGKLQLRTGGGSGTTVTSGYYGSSLANASTTTTFANESSNNGTYYAIANTPGTSTTFTSASWVFTNVGNASEYARWSGTGMNGTYQTMLFGGTNSAADTYTGLIFSSISSNVSGTIAIYGMAAA